MSFHEISYKLHEDEKHTQVESCSLDLYRDWFDSGTVDLWRHLRMLSSLDPLLEEFPGARWLTVGDGTYGTSSIYIGKKAGDALPVDINISLLEVCQAGRHNSRLQKRKRRGLVVSRRLIRFCFLQRGVPPLSPACSGVIRNAESEPDGGGSG